MTASTIVPKDHDYRRVFLVELGLDSGDFFDVIILILLGNLGLLSFIGLILLNQRRYASATVSEVDRCHLAIRRGTGPDFEVSDLTLFDLSACVSVANTLDSPASWSLLISVLESLDRGEDQKGRNGAVLRRIKVAIDMDTFC